MKRILLPLAVLALAACSQGADEAPAPEETMMPVERDGGIGDGAGPPVAEAIASIPVAFLGVWDYVDGTCDPASDMRLDIGEQAIGFYESTGTVADVRDEDGTTYVDLAMSGEGETWETTLGLRLVDAGTQLMVITAEAPDDAEKYMRKRCQD